MNIPILNVFTSPQLEIFVLARFSPETYGIDISLDQLASYQKSKETVLFLRPKYIKQAKDN
jgi:hypothetical protein